MQVLASTVGTRGRPKKSDGSTLTRHRIRLANVTNHNRSGVNDASRFRMIPKRTDWIIDECQLIIYPKHKRESITIAQLRSDFGPFVFDHSLNANTLLIKFPNPKVSSAIVMAYSERFNIQYAWTQWCDSVFESSANDTNVERRSDQRWASSASSSSSSVAHCRNSKYCNRIHSHEMRYISHIYQILTHKTHPLLRRLMQHRSAAGKMNSFQTNLDRITTISIPNPTVPPLHSHSHPPRRRRPPHPQSQRIRTHNSGTPTDDTTVDNVPPLPSPPALPPLHPPTPSQPPLPSQSQPSQRSDDDRKTTNEEKSPYKTTTMSATAAIFEPLSTPTMTTPTMTTPTMTTTKPNPNPHPRRRPTVPPPVTASVAAVAQPYHPLQDAYLMRQLEKMFPQRPTQPPPSQSQSQQPSYNNSSRITNNSNNSNSRNNDNASLMHPQPYHRRYTTVSDIVNAVSSVMNNIHPSTQQQTPTTNAAAAAMNAMHNYNPSMGGHNTVSQQSTVPPSLPMIPSQQSQSQQSQQPMIGNNNMGTHQMMTGHTLFQYFGEPHNGLPMPDRMDDDLCYTFLNSGMCPHRSKCLWRHFDFAYSVSDYECTEYISKTLWQRFISQYTAAIISTANATVNHTATSAAAQSTATATAVPPPPHYHSSMSPSMSASSPYAMYSYSSLPQQWQPATTDAAAINGNGDTVTPTVLPPFPIPTQNERKVDYNVCWDYNTAKGCRRGIGCQWKHIRFTRR